jgi:hypothetical protein
MIEELVAHADWLPPRLSSEARERLIEDLTDGIGFALAGLSSVLRGKQARPAARVLDILYRDVSDALLRAGVGSRMNPDPSLARVQSLVKEIAGRIGLKGHDDRGVGNLFKQAQRSRQIEKHKLPDVLIELDPATREQVVTIGDPGTPISKRRRCSPVT